MSKKGGNFFEEHIEKIILGIVGLLCVWIFVTRVLISPNYVKYDDKKLSPGDIDVYISKQTMLLEEELNRKPELKQLYESQLGNFTAKVNSPISGLDVNLYLPLPIFTSRAASDNRVYTLPPIGEATDVAVEHIRAVAYVPTEEVDERNVYEQAKYKPDDIDFVTVEAKFDAAGLYERFYKNFAGENVKEEWRDPCLATPVFAAVQLQRQELLSDGSWGDWQIVPRTRIDSHKKTFEVIEDIGKLPAGGVKVRMLQFNDKALVMDLLQPEAYRIASAKEEWFPPELHKKFVEQQRTTDAEEKRQVKVKEKEERDREREQARLGRGSRTSTTRTRSGRGTAGEIGVGVPGGSAGSDENAGGSGSAGGGRAIPPTRRTPTGKRSERQKEKERPVESKDVSKTTTTDVYSEFNKILITNKDNLAKMREPLIFWAHDDTVEPEKSYQYRIQIGIFNPIAGTNQVSEQDKSLKNHVILWGDFSDVTEIVEIPATLYIFPREIQEAAKIVTVQVSKYVLGYWYSRDFIVRPGEVIGKLLEYVPTAEEEQKKITVPEKVDYATEAVLVDAIPVNDWSGGKNLRPRSYWDMLYSFDGTDIERMPIRLRYWTDELLTEYNEIKKIEKEPKEPLRDWGSGPSERRRQPQRPATPGRVGGSAGEDELGM
jgi:hypothetical protein